MATVGVKGLTQNALADVEHYILARSKHVKNLADWSTLVLCDVLCVIAIMFHELIKSAISDLCCIGHIGSEGTFV